MTNDMHFGYYVLPEHPGDTDPKKTLETVLADAHLAEDLGFESLWVGEHHFTDKVYFDNFQLLSHLAAETSDVTLGTSVCLVPLYNPVRLAERTANLDVLSGGRFTLGAAVGYRPQEFEIMGIDRSRRGPRMRETIQLLRRLWTEDNISFDGSEFTFENVSINPKPIQEGGPSIWLGGSSETPVGRAAVRGNAWLIDPRISIGALDEAHEHYENVLEDRGLTPEARPIWREVFVAETDKEAVKKARPYLLEKYDSYLDWGAADAVGDDDISTQFRELSEGRFLLGSPDTVTERIEEYRERYGIDHLILRTRWPGMDQDVAADSLRLFAEEVAPRFD